MASLAKNTAMLTVASMLQKAVAFVYFAAIARMIGTENTGSYFLALTLVTTIGVLTDLGLNSVLIRDSARDQEHTVMLLRRVFSLKLIAAPIAGFVAAVLPHVLGYDAETTFLILLAIPVMLADSISLTMYGALRGAQELRYEALGIFLGQVFTTIIGIVVLFWIDASLPMLILALFVGSSWNAAFSAYHVGKRFGFHTFIPSFTEWRSLSLAALPFFLAAVFVKIYSFIDSYMLGIVIGATAAGLYSVAYKLTYAFQFLPLAFIGALYPKMASLTGKPEELKKVFLNAEWYLALLVSPIVFGIFALAPEIITLVYGTEYAGSVLPLSVLIFVLIPIFFDFPIGSLLNASGRQHVKTVIMGVTMAVNILANIFLIRWYGVLGASLAGCVSFVVMFCLGALMIRGQIAITVKDWFQSVGGFLLSGFIMATAILLVKSVFPMADNGISRYLWIALIPFGAMIFTGVAYGTGTFTTAHFSQIRSFFRKTSYGTTPVAHE